MSLQHGSPLCMYYMKIPEHTLTAYANRSILNIDIRHLHDRISGKTDHVITMERLDQVISTLY